ncbi:MAG: PD-(D/E)XK nuclease family protein [Candidatus Aminicenantes bacterium]|nr:PD-(D/E)XK nuclease family protein [Candidatus Aminicenantes bacterium]
MTSLPRGYLSHSQVRLYGECPQKYYFAYIEEIPVRVNEKVFLGEIFHSTLEEYFTRQINGFCADEALTVAVFREAFTAQGKERDIDWQVSQRETLARGMAFIKYFLAHIAPKLKPLMVEKELSAEIPEIGVTLKGVIDLVEADFGIIDFKTTTSKWSANKARNSLQMIIYKYLFDRNFGNVHGSLKYEILYAKNAARIRHQSLEVIPGPEDIAQMLHLIKHVADNIRAGVFYPQANHFCAYCDFFAACRKKNPGLLTAKC